MTNFDPFVSWDPEEHPLSLLVASLIFGSPGHTSHSGPVGPWKYSLLSSVLPHVMPTWDSSFSSPTTDHHNILASPLLSSPAALLSSPSLSFPYPIPIIRFSIKPCLFSSKLSFLKSGVIHSPYPSHK